MPTPSGMRGDNGASSTENLRNASVRDRSVGQTASRRLLSGLPPDSRLPQETRGGKGIKFGIIKFGIRFCPRCFSCQKFLFSESNGRRISLSFVPSWLVSSQWRGLCCAFFSGFLLAGDFCGSISLSGMSRFSIQSCRVVRDMDLGFCRQKHCSYLLPT